jgi:hypothetical protein
VSRLDEVPRHRLTHIAKTDKTDVHPALLWKPPRRRRRRAASASADRAIANVIAADA